MIPALTARHWKRPVSAGRGCFVGYLAWTCRQFSISGYKRNLVIKREVPDGIW
jgi:hypothetical protein